ncbi:hypothetical protein BGY98DRAFT_418975 [Russula aff. rugulosa BPL654]|nr:hypothetical protein BGY98DRAFT_418975 [Russula aff. rugulosa BPL654]
MVTALDGIERIPIFFLVFLSPYAGLSSASKPSMRHHFLDLGGPCVVFCLGEDVDESVAFRSARTDRWCQGRMLRYPDCLVSGPGR